MTNLVGFLQRLQGIPHHRKMEGGGHRDAHRADLSQQRPVIAVGFGSQGPGHLLGQSLVEVGHPHQFRLF